LKEKKTCCAFRFGTRIEFINGNVVTFLEKSQNHEVQLNLVKRPILRLFLITNPATKRRLVGATPQNIVIFCSLAPGY